MRLMYLHAYQSFVWNEVTSKRVQLYGLKTHVGDLVRNKSNPESVVTLNEENISQYNIYDVVLPLPGHSIVYPTEDVGNFYTELLSKDGIDKENFKNKIKYIFNSFCLKQKN